MLKIALVPMAAKPYHAGHDGLVRIASEECDKVKVFVSTADRQRSGELSISGNDMLQIWEKYILPSLPTNVEVQYVSVPVQSVFAELEHAEAIGDTKTTFVIYSDKEDILKYTEKSLSRSAPTIFDNQQIELRGVDRNETVNISGTAMRNFIANGDIEAFIEMLPIAIQQFGQEIYNILSKKHMTATESLLRSYIKSIILK